MKRKLEHVLCMFQKEIKSINYLDLNLLMHGDKFLGGRGEEIKKDERKTNSVYNLK